MLSLHAYCIWLNPFIAFVNLPVFTSITPFCQPLMPPPAGLVLSLLPSTFPTTPLPRVHLYRFALLALHASYSLFNPFIAPFNLPVNATISILPVSPSCLYSLWFHSLQLPPQSFPFSHGPSLAPSPSLFPSPRYPIPPPFARPSRANGVSGIIGITVLVLVKLLRRDRFSWYWLVTPTRHPPPSLVVSLSVSLSMSLPPCSYSLGVCMSVFPG